MRYCSVLFTLSSEKIASPGSAQFLRQCPRNCACLPPTDKLRASIYYRYSMFNTGTLVPVRKSTVSVCQKTYSTVRPTLTVKWKVKLKVPPVLPLNDRLKKPPSHRTSIFRVFWSDPPSGRKQKSPWTPHSALRAFRPWWSKCAITGGVLERSTLASVL